MPFFDEWNYGADDDPDYRARAVKNNLARIGISLDGGKLAGADPERKSDRQTWQATARWDQRYDHRGNYTSHLERCDEHPRLERLTKLYMDGKVVRTWFVNGIGQGTEAAAMAELERAEAQGKYPGSTESYLTRPDPEKPRKPAFAAGDEPEANPE